MYLNFSCTAAIAVVLTFLTSGWQPIQAQGYWVRTGKVEYHVLAGKDRMPTVGSLRLNVNGWDSLNEADDTSIKTTARLGKRATVIAQVTWGARPLVIIPGEVIPVGGEGKVIATEGEASRKMGPDGQATLICQLLLRKTVLDEKKQQVDKWTHLKDLFPKPNFVDARGKAGASSSDVNTEVVFGETGKSYKEVTPIYIRYLAGTSYAGDSYSIGYEYVWNEGPVTDELREKMKEDAEEFEKKKKEKAGVPGQGDDTNPDPGPGKMSLIDASGQWTIYSLGEVGTYDEKTVHYQGTLDFKESATGGYSGTVSFGSPETLREVSLQWGVLEFTRPLAGVTQKYTGRSTAEDKIEGTFTHDAKTFAWRAERVVVKKDK